MASAEQRPDGVTWRGAALLVETILFSVLVPGTVTYWLPKYGFDFWGEAAPSHRSAREFAALAPFAVGGAIYLRCVFEFATRGRGIPLPIDHPKQLVVTGLYRYVRNPMYLGVLLMLLGECLYFGSMDFLVYTLGWLALVQTFVLLYEEPNLKRKFGASYDHYRAAVRRWIPGPRYQSPRV